MSHHLFWAAVPVVLVVAPTAEGRPLGTEESRLAIVVGNNVGLGGEQPLEYAEEDARRVHELLTTVGGIPTDRAYLLLNQTATDLKLTLAKVSGRIQELAAGGPVSLVLYISSHADQEAVHLSGTNLTYDELRQALSTMNTQFRLILVDGCQVPVSIQLRGGTPAEPVAIDVADNPRTEGEVFIRSASVGEPAQEWTYLRGALFTHHLLSGLRGAADFDGDGKVTLMEAYTYTYRNTTNEAVRASARPQRPTYDFDYRGFGNWQFSQPERLGAAIELGKDLSGRFWIADRGNRMVSELGKESGYVVRVALKPGWYRVVEPRGTYVHATDVNLHWGGTKSLKTSDFVRMPYRRVRLRGAEPIVLRPFQIGVGYGLSTATVNGLGPMHLVGVGLRYGFTDWFGAARFGATYGTLSAYRLQIQHYELRAALVGGYTFHFLEPLELGLGLAAELGWARQTGQRDATAISSMPSGNKEPDRDALLFATGPALLVALPLSDRLRVELEVDAGLEWAPNDEGKMNIRGFTRGWIFVGWRL